MSSLFLTTVFMSFLCISVVYQLSILCFALHIFFSLTITCSFCLTLLSSKSLPFIPLSPLSLFLIPCGCIPSIPFYALPILFLPPSVLSASASAFFFFIHSIRPHFVLPPTVLLPLILFISSIPMYSLFPLCLLLSLLLLPAFCHLYICPPYFCFLSFCFHPSDFIIYI